MKVYVTCKFKNNRTSYLYILTYSIIFCLYNNINYASSPNFTCISFRRHYYFSIYVIDCLVV